VRCYTFVIDITACHRLIAFDVESKLNSDVNKTFRSTKATTFHAISNVLA